MFSPGQFLGDLKNVSSNLKNVSSKEPPKKISEPLPPHASIAHPLSVMALSNRFSEHSTVFSSIASEIAMASSSPSPFPLSDNAFSLEPFGNDKKYLNTCPICGVRSAFDARAMGVLF